MKEMFLLLGIMDLLDLKKSCKMSDNKVKTLSSLKSVICIENPRTRTVHDLLKEKKDDPQYNSGPPAYSITVGKRYDVYEECLTHYWITNDKGSRMPYLRRFFDEDVLK